MRWRPTRAEARAHRRNQATREALVQCPDVLATVSPPCGCATSVETQGSWSTARANPCGEPRDAPARGRAIVPGGDETMSPSPRTRQTPWVRGPTVISTAVACAKPYATRTARSCAVPVAPPLTRPRHRAEQASGRSRWVCQVLDVPVSPRCRQRGDTRAARGARARQQPHAGVAVGRRCPNRPAQRAPAAEAAGVCR